MMTRRQFLSTFFAGLALAGLSACGRKNQPKHPAGSEFPHDYPYVPPEKRTLKIQPQDQEEQKPADRGQYLKLDPIQDRSR